jgi:DNA-directed RNA polymerase subunit RPC12/RpoP
MAKLRTHACPTCGAPLPVAPGTTDVRCQYCGNVIHVEWRRPPAQQVMPQTVYVPQRSYAWVIWVVVLGSLVPVFVPLLIFVVPLVFRTATEAGVVKPSFPVTCGMNEEVNLVGQTYEGSGTLITGEVNCKLRIKDCKLKGDVVILAKNLVDITLENSELSGKAAAVRIEMNSKLSATGKTSIKGEEAGIAAGMNAEVSLEDSSVEGGEEGIHAQHNCKLTASRSRIIGGEKGLVAAANLSVDGRDLTVQGRDAAIETESNPTLKLRGGTLEGQQFALRVTSSNADLRLSHGARIAAKETAIRAGVMLRLEGEDFVIDGGEVGVDVDSNAKITLGPKARIHGRQFGVRATSNLELDLRSASIESESVAVCASSNAEVRARDSSIQGGVSAWRFSRRPDPLELPGTRISGTQQFNARGCTGPGSSL